MDYLSLALNNSGVGGYLGDAFYIIYVMLMIYVLLACPPITLLGII